MVSIRWCGSAAHVHAASSRNTRDSPPAVRLEREPAVLQPNDTTPIPSKGEPSDLKSPLIPRPIGGADGGGSVNGLLDSSSASVDVSLMREMSKDESGVGAIALSAVMLQTSVAVYGMRARGRGGSWHAANTGEGDAWVILTSARPCALVSFFVRSPKENIP